MANWKLFHLELEKRVAHCVGSNETVALFLLDLDGFKQVNDTLGHSFGDRLLVLVAEDISRSMGSGSLLARLGGDEFALIVSGIATEAAAVDFAGHLVAAFLRPLQLGQSVVDVTTSIGCTLVPRDGRSVEELLRNADLALYSAKRAGKGRIDFYREAMLTALRRSTDMAQELSKAAERGELAVAYQPQVRLADGAVVGFEALLRWAHPRLGNISPAVFVPLAESNGMMEGLGNWILHAACRQASDWRKAGQPPRDVAVNVSAVQLSSRFPVEVRAALELSGLPPQYLCLELTESVYAGRHTAGVQAVMGELKSLGIKLALDDFGTGYSSLSSLGNMPFNKLKIDRSFVQDVPNSLKRQKLLQGIIKLGSALGCTIVAEGAESLSEVAILQSYGVDVVQGYYFSKPLCAPDAAQQFRYTMDALEFNAAKALQR